MGYNRMNNSRFFGTIFCPMIIVHCSHDGRTESYISSCDDRRRKFVVEETSEREGEGDEMRNMMVHRFAK